MHQTRTMPITKLSPKFSGRGRLSGSNYLEDDGVAEGANSSTWSAGELFPGVASGKGPESDPVIGGANLRR
jgi:hypothetical protein